MGWLGSILILVFVGLCAWAIGWVQGEQEGYDRATDEWLKREPKPREWKKPEGV